MNISVTLIPSYPSSTLVISLTLLIKNFYFGKTFWKKKNVIMFLNLRKNDFFNLNNLPKIAIFAYSMKGFLRLSIFIFWI
jgi:hypothetical protein